MVKLHFCFLTFEVAKYSFLTCHMLKHEKQQSGPETMVASKDDAIVKRGATRHVPLKVVLQRESLHEFWSSTCSGVATGTGWALQSSLQSSFQVFWKLDKSKKWNPYKWLLVDLGLSVNAVGLFQYKCWTVGQCCRSLSIVSTVVLTYQHCVAIAAVVD